jgi:hypothetical protein
MPVDYKTVTRQLRLAKLIEHYEPDAKLGHADVDDGKSFALVSQESGHGLDGTMITSHDTFADACAYAGDSVLDGWDPLGVFNLDTCELINLHIASPVVTRSEDQGVLENPIANGFT